MTRGQEMGRRMALVTGASSGIGFELARLLAEGDHDLVLVARDGAKLEGRAQELGAQHHVSVRWQATDLSVPGAAEALWDRLNVEEVAIDVLVNSAGVGLHGPVLAQSPEALARMLHLNVVSLTTLTRLVLPGMEERRWGRILNVASLAAHQPGGPGMAAYYASKAYVLSFSRALAREVRGSGVSVTALCPGPTETAFEARAGASRTLLYRGPKMSASAVARAGYRGMMRGSSVVVPGVVAKILAFAGELPPRQIALEVNRLLLMPR